MGKGMGQNAEHHQWFQERSPRVLVMLGLMWWIQFLFSWDSCVQTAPKHHLQALEKQLFGFLRFCQPGAWFSCLNSVIWNNFEISCLSLSRFSRCNKLCERLVPAKNYLGCSMASQNAFINHLRIENYHSPRPPLAIAGACTHSSQVETRTNTWIWVYLWAESH